MKILEIPCPLLLSPHLRVSDTRRFHTDSLRQPASYGRIIGRFGVKGGVAIPYGIYDVHENRGTLVVGLSHDTPAFAAHAIAHWWRQEGSRRYSASRQLLILADTGGSNSCRCYAWKT